MISRVPVFTDDPGWHGKRLKEAFSVRGVEAVFISLKDCAFNLVPEATGVMVPGFDGLPQGVFVRGVPGGTVQQVIQRLNILHALKALGAVVYNDGREIERTVDKAMTSFLLHSHQVRSPATWVCESRHLAQQVIARETMAGRPLVIKPLFGSQGKGVRRIEAGAPFPVPMEDHVDGVYYLQQYIDSGEGAWHDFRVFIINNRVAGAMVRHGSHWVNNVAQGGRCEPLRDADDVAEIAIAAAKAVDINYCGVDVIRDRHGRLFVLEVNSIPAWKGLQGVVECDIAQALVDDFLGKLDSVSNTQVA